MSNHTNETRVSAFINMDLYIRLNYHASLGKKSKKDIIIEALEAYLPKLSISMEEK